MKTITLRKGDLVDLPPPDWGDVGRVAVITAIYPHIDGNLMATLHTGREELDCSLDDLQLFASVKKEREYGHRTGQRFVQLTLTKANGAPIRRDVMIRSERNGLSVCRHIALAALVNQEWQQKQKQKGVA